jgi:hypothetical protein
MVASPEVRHISATSVIILLEKVLAGLQARYSLEITNKLPNDLMHRIQEDKFWSLSIADRVNGFPRSCCLQTSGARAWEFGIRGTLPFSAAAAEAIPLSSTMFINMPKITKSPTFTIAATRHTAPAAGAGDHFWTTVYRRNNSQDNFLFGKDKDQASPQPGNSINAEHNGGDSMRETSVNSSFFDISATSPGDASSSFASAAPTSAQNAGGSAAVGIPSTTPEERQEEENFTTDQPVMAHHTT